MPIRGKQQDMLDGMPAPPLVSYGQRLKTGRGRSRRQNPEHITQATRPHHDASTLPTTTLLRRILSRAFAVYYPVYERIVPNAVPPW